MVPNHPRERDAHCHEGEYQPHPVAPLPEGEGRILPVITAPFLTPLPAGSLWIPHKSHRIDGRRRDRQIEFSMS